MSRLMAVAAVLAALAAATAASAADKLVLQLHGPAQFEFAGYYAALWQERLPDARLVMIEECGHLPHVEHAGLVARHVCDFLEGVGS